MWTYVQKTGELLRDGLHIALGYSGFDDPETGQRGKNNPELARVEEVGPIPVGKYFIGIPHDTLTHGAFVLPLKPEAENEMFGRSAFLMHGDSVVEPGTASRGCIVMSRAVRRQVAASGDKVLQVISGVAEDVRVA
ncbi:MAG: tlde1 domain-containing protein [Terriglobales bacterium]